MRYLSAKLVIVLAIIAAVVTVGLLAGFNMYPFIIVYWATLTIKNTVDYFSRRR